MYQNRLYRNRISKSRLTAFRVCVKETDLEVYARENLEGVTRELVLRHREPLERYIRSRPEFAKTLLPWPLNGMEPPMVREMIQAGQKAGVGPMAAVAGTMAELVGRDLLEHSEEVMVENGGDVFLRVREPVVVGLFAGRSPLSMKIGLRLACTQEGAGVCTSSGTVGHSLSLGQADAVCVVSGSCSLADAAATAIGNRVKNKAHIPDAISFGRQIEGVKGIVIVLMDKIGAWGEVELVSLSGKRG